MKKLIAAVLLLAAPSPFLVACTEERPAVTTPAPATFPWLPEGAAEEVPVLPDLPYYGAYEFCFLVSGNSPKNEFSASEDDSEALSAARLRRNRYVEEALDIRLSNCDLLQPGTTNGAGPGYTELKRCYTAGSTDYDAGLIGSEDACTLAAGGYLAGLGDLPYLNLDSKWWDAGANRDFCVNGRLFCTTGALCLTDRSFTHCVLVNKALLRSCDGLLDPYLLVREKQWTFPVFAAEVKKVREWVDTADSADGGEEAAPYGLMIWEDAAVAALNAFGCRICTVADGELTLTLNREETLRALSDYADLVFSDSCFRYQEKTRPSEWEELSFSSLREGRVCYSLATFRTVPEHRAAGTDLGILPYPMLNAEQESYASPVSSFYGQLFCVPFFIDDAERTGVVSALLGYASDQLLIPVSETELLGDGEKRDRESAETLPIIFGSRVFDLGIYYRVGNLAPALADLIAEGNLSDFPEFYRRLASSAEQAVELLNRKFSEIS